MKKLVLLLIIGTIPHLSFSQYQWIKLDNGEIFFEKVYDRDSVDEKSIEKLLVSSIPRSKCVSDFVKTEGLITAKMSDCYVDYKKYGGKWGTTLAHFNHPMFANVTVVWKDNKYRVTVSNIYWLTAGLGKLTATETFTKRRATIIDPGKVAVNGGRYLEQFLSDVFSIQSSQKSDW